MPGPPEFGGRNDSVMASRVSLSFDDSGRAQEFALDLVEDAIDELAAVLGGEFFGDVNRFIDAHDRGDVFAVEHFVHAETKDVAAHDGEAVQRPVSAVAL